jgi:hypothetical protein
MPSLLVSLPASQSHRAEGIGVLRADSPDIRTLALIGAAMWTVVNKLASYHVGAQPEHITERTETSRTAG